MKLLRDSIAKDATITSFNTVSGSDITNLLDARLSKYTLFTYYNGITLTLTYDLSVSFSAIALLGYSLSGDTYLEINGSSPILLGDVQNGFTELQSTVSGTSFVLKLTNASTLNGTQTKIGRLILGDVYNTPGINSNVSFDTISNADVAFSRSRQAFGNPGAIYNNISVVFPVIEQNEKADLDYFLKSVDRYEPFVLAFDEECFSEGPFYVVVNDTTLSGYQLNEALFWTSRLSFTEVF